MKKIIIFIFLTTGSLSYAKDSATTKSCLSSIASQVISFLQDRQPNAKLTTMVNQDDQIVGLTDAAGIFPDIDVTRTVNVSVNIQATYFEFDNMAIRAQYQVKDSKNTLSCKSQSIQMIEAE